MRLRCIDRHREDRRVLEQLCGELWIASASHRGGERQQQENKTWISQIRGDYTDDFEEGGHRKIRQKLTRNQSLDDNFKRSCHPEQSNRAKRDYGVEGSSSV